VLTALADPRRRAMFEHLAERPRAVGELARELPVSRPAVSQHLKVLKGAGLVVGTRRIYQVKSERAGRATRLSGPLLEPGSGRLQDTHTYSQAGTYFAGLRATSQRDGDTDTSLNQITSYGFVYNLGRARVVVH
jgi:DNA-binding transcriptional ArsR family regulator